MSLKSVFFPYKVQRTCSISRKTKKLAKTVFIEPPLLNPIISKKRRPWLLLHRPHHHHTLFYLLIHLCQFSHRPFIVTTRQVFYVLYHNARVAVTTALGSPHHSSSHCLFNPVQWPRWRPSRGHRPHPAEDQVSCCCFLRPFFVLFPQTRQKVILRVNRHFFSREFGKLLVFFWKLKKYLRKCEEF